MAESTLQFFSIAAVLASVRWVGEAHTSRRIGLAGMGAGIVFGLAVAAKQSAVSLALVALASVVAVGWDASTPGTRLRRISGLAIIVAASAMLTFVAVNPVLYDQPIRAAHTMITVRQTLAANQAKYTQTVNPPMVLPGVMTRLAASYRQVLWNPPAFSEFTAYDDKIAPEVKFYTERWETRAAANHSVRIALILITLLGTVAAVSMIVKDGFGSRTRPLQIVLVWTVANTVFIAAFVPLDWQRYFVPLVPPTCVLAGYGAARLVALFAPSADIA
jgi:4-amino-4-deoxy-L-arabinose transferase-like glycosyltransferase